jgi:hypothetical protein
MNYTSIIESAEDYLISGLSVLPCGENKRPVRGEWASLQTSPMPLENTEAEFRNAEYIAVITGQVSGNLEGIDFDNHDQGIEKHYNDWKLENAEIFAKYDIYIEKTKRGGFHVLYRIDSEEIYNTRVLARWETKETMIETKAEGGYFIVAPSAGYTRVSGDLTLIPTIRPDERDQLIQSARKLTKLAQTTDEASAENEHHEFTDPISWYNWNKSTYSKNLLMDEGWSKTVDKNKVEYWSKPGTKNDTHATWGHKYNALYVFSTSALPFKNECYYTPFQILVMLKFKGNYYAAINWISIFYLNEDSPYIRIGVDYFKKIQKKDRFGIIGIDLKKWKKEEIKDDHGKGYLTRVPKFDNFCIEPDNFNYQPVIENCYNLYHAFRHKESKGEIKWSRILMEHIFGDQVELGFRYLQCLYLHPDRMLPILVLVSRERQTGKTTFLNWLNMIFGDNCVMINPSDLTSDFNSSYATANVIEIEETLIEKSITVEKLKALATGKFVSVNEKFISNYKLPFFGKIILASNNEDKFAKVDEEEIRFFVRKVGKPIYKNHDVENNLRDEIPAFLSYLSSLPAVDFSVGRVPFTVEELKNETLTAVKKESKTGLYKDMFERFVDQFSNGSKNDESIFVVPVDIKDRWYKNSHNIDIHYIRTVLKNEFNLKPGFAIRYIPFGDVGTYSSKVGTAYEIKRSIFGISEFEEEKSEFINYTDINKDLPF